MDRFGHIVVQIRNPNPEVALHSMLLTLRLDKFAVSLCKKNLVGWTSCANEPKTISRWKRCLGLETRFDKLDKSTTREKEVPRTTHTSRAKGTSQTNASP